MSSAKWRSICFGLNVLKLMFSTLRYSSVARMSLHGYCIPCLLAHCGGKAYTHIAVRYTFLNITSGHCFIFPTSWKQPEMITKTPVLHTYHKIIDVYLHRMYLKKKHFPIPCSLFLSNTPVPSLSVDLIWSRKQKQKLICISSNTNMVKIIEVEDGVLFIRQINFPLVAVLTPVRLHLYLYFIWQYDIFPICWTHCCLVTAYGDCDLGRQCLR